MAYHIHSDGACINNGLENAVASWSYIVTDDSNTVVQASTGRVIGQQDNNRAELTAFINALQYVSSNKGNYIIHVDYQALYLYCNGKASPKANRDLYREISRLMMRCGNRFIVAKVEAHKARSGISNFINGVVDKLARRSIEYFGTEGALKKAS